jgi:predicted protein tyrosine phosphatase
MQIFVCPRDWTFATDRFTPDHLVSLQNPDADISELRPPWISPENHHVSYFYDAAFDLDHGDAPSLEAIRQVIEWLTPRCGQSSGARIIIHCDAGLGRSPAVAYIAWALHFGVGREQEAFEAMRQSCLNTQIIPNPVIVAHADEILQRAGALKKPLTRWNKRVTHTRTIR